MTGVPGHYLDSIRNNLRLDRSIETEVMSELESHVEDELQALKKTGMSEEEALDTWVRLLGAAKLVARQIYEAHSQPGYFPGLVIFYASGKLGIIAFLLPILVIAGLFVAPALLDRKIRHAGKQRAVEMLLR